MPDFPPVEVPVVEGDYSGYALKWESVTTNLRQVCERSHFNTDDSVCYLYDFDDLAVITIADGSFVEHIGLANVLDLQSRDKSVYGKYSVVVHINLVQMEVFKDGVSLQVIGVEDPADDIEGVIVSNTGKYIIIVYQDTSPTEYTFKCYEGS